MTKESLVVVNGRSYLFPFILISSLFLLWGTAHSLLDVLNKHFQDALGISKAKSGLVQFAMYGGYFITALPAGRLIRRYGYKKVIVLGLLLFATGAFLFIPISIIKEFWAVLTALFIIACGLACLETAANPYSTILGPEGSAERRINLSQSFNGIGWIIGPISGLMIFGNSSIDKFGSLSIPYVILGTSVLLIALLFFIVKLPNVNIDKECEDNKTSHNYSVWKNNVFVFAVIAQFLYVAAQTGINSMFINYVIENTSHINIVFASFFSSSSSSIVFRTPESTASMILALGGMGCFFIGRLSGSYLMKYINPSKLLSSYASINVVLMILTILNLGLFSIIALFLSYFFMSIMFPTIFSLGIRDLRSNKEEGASFLIMAIVGGALCPILMGGTADKFSSAIAFLWPLLCFLIISIFAIYVTKKNHIIDEV